MAIQLACSSYVENGEPRKPCARMSVTPGIEAYLEAHVTSLARRGRSGAAPPARFGSDRGRRAFSSLKAGPDADFLATADSLAGELHRLMDRRTSRGLFVALRRSDQPRVAVLKLDIGDKRAAALGAAGDISPVDALLDVEGSLQKGALTDDPRPDSNVVVGDKLDLTSKFFLDALDIVQFQKPSKAVADIVRQVQRVAPETAEQVIGRLAVSDATTVDDFLDSVADLMDDDKREVVRSELGAQERPALFLAKAPVQKRIEGNGITVTGTPAAMEKARLEHVEGTDRWRLEIEFTGEPEISF